METENRKFRIGTRVVTNCLCVGIEIHDDVPVDMVITMGLKGKVITYSSVRCCVLFDGREHWTLMSEDMLDKVTGEIDIEFPKSEDWT